jgi:hypothetical protein
VNDDDTPSPGPSVAADGPGGFTKSPTCDLCEAARITPWFHEDDVCWIAECEICATPMVVWRWHGTEPPPEHRAHMESELTRVGTEVFGEIYLDGHMRNIPDHFHVHARPKGGFFGHGIRR